MAGLSVLVSSVGAGVSQVRFQAPDRGQAQLKEQEGLPKDVGGAALRLIQQVMSAAETTGRDLDVLA
jgi:hypothetical protein